jgi:hypothetical protein
VEGGWRMDGVGDGGEWMKGGGRERGKGREGGRRSLTFF